MTTRRRYSQKWHDFWWITIAYTVWFGLAYAVWRGIGAP